MLVLLSLSLYGPLPLLLLLRLLLLYTVTATATAAAAVAALTARTHAASAASAAAAAASATCLNADNTSKSESHIGFQYDSNFKNISGPNFCCFGVARRHHALDSLQPSQFTTPLKTGQPKLVLVAGLLAFNALGFGSCHAT